MMWWSRRGGTHSQQEQRGPVDSWIMSSCRSSTGNRGGGNRRFLSSVSVGFGVVAAMTRNRVIGIHGGLPWQDLPKDRKIFRALTTNKILILGRKTFFEQHPTTTTTTTSLDHIRHARCCIVVSSSMTRIGLETVQPLAPTTELKLARSLSEALELAQAMTSTFKKKKEEDEEEVTAGIRGISSPVDCWVAGGQGLYEEALLVSSSSSSTQQQQQLGASAVVEVHLSVVDLDIPETTVVQENDDDDCRRIARFPDPLRWKDQFEQVSKVEFPPETEMRNGSDEKNVIVPGFTYYYYKRILD